MIKLVDREELMRERQQKRELEAAKAAEKERKKAEAAAKAKALEELKKIPPSEMFKPDNILRFESFKSDPKYSKFDDKVRLRILFCAAILQLSSCVNDHDRD